MLESQFGYFTWSNDPKSIKHLDHNLDKASAIEKVRNLPADGRVLLTDKTSMSLAIAVAGALINQLDQVKVMSTLHSDVIEAVRSHFSMPSSVFTSIVVIAPSAGESKISTSPGLR